MSRVIPSGQTKIDETHAAARAYLQHGWSVIPIEPRGKRPIIKWTTYQSRTPTMHEIDGWFAKADNFNIAIVTGKLSGIVVLDVDPSHQGAISLQSWENQHSPLPTTFEVRTGGGGRHLYFKHPGTRTPNRANLAAGIDLRGDGGCVVAPPSLHRSGHHYQWLKGHSPQETTLAAMPDWLAAMVKRKR